MIVDIEQTFDAFQQGRIDRRQAVLRLGAIVAALCGAGGPLVAQEPSESTFNSIGLYHIALRVTDVAGSRDFYAKHLGLRVLSQSERNCFMSCGDDQFVALFRGDKPGLDHYCYTIPEYDPARVVETLRSVGLEPQRHQNRVYFDDLDGLTVQISGRRDAWPG